MCLVGLRNEVLSLIMCVLIGCFWGIIAPLANTPYNRDWPSQEMLGRGDPFGLASGILIAIPSGVATALRFVDSCDMSMPCAHYVDLTPIKLVDFDLPVLWDEIAVVWWAWPLVFRCFLRPSIVDCAGRMQPCFVFHSLSETKVSTLPVIGGASVEFTNIVAFVRIVGDYTDYVTTGGISIALTFVNILCIWIAGTSTFWLKEVAPVSRKNAFWTRDVKNYREQEGGVGALQVDTQVINEGIEAALELQQNAGKDVYEGDFDADINASKVAAARREGLASNAWEDAMFLDQDFGMEGKAVVGGAADAAIPDQITLQNIKKRKSATASLIYNANQLGGLGEAGETLFDNNILPPIDENVELPSDADGVNHDDVAKKILLQKYD